MSSSQPVNSVNIEVTSSEPANIEAASSVASTATASSIAIAAIISPARSQVCSMVNIEEGGYGRCRCPQPGYQGELYPGEKPLHCDHSDPTGFLQCACKAQQICGECQCWLNSSFYGDGSGNEELEAAGFRRVGWDVRSGSLFCVDCPVPEKAPQEGFAFHFNREMS